MADGPVRLYLSPLSFAYIIHFFSLKRNERFHQKSCYYSNKNISLVLLYVYKRKAASLENNKRYAIQLKKSIH